MVAAGLREEEELRDRVVFMFYVLQLDRSFMVFKWRSDGRGRGDVTSRRGHREISRNGESMLYGSQDEGTDLALLRDSFVQLRLCQPITALVTPFVCLSNRNKEVMPYPGLSWPNLCTQKLLQGNRVPHRVIAPEKTTQVPS